MCLKITDVFIRLDLDENLEKYKCIIYICSEGKYDGKYS